MIVISSSVVLGPPSEAIDGRNPRIGYHNIVTYNNVTADYQTTDEPASNLGNPSTAERWRSSSLLTQNVTVNAGVALDVNYFAIAKHNFGSSGATVQLEYSSDGTTWTAATSPEIPGSDHVLMHEFDPVFARYFRLVITPGTAAPTMAVLYIGRTLVLQRRIYVGHTPIPYGRKAAIVSGRSENGQFLGRVLKREFLETAVNLQNLTPGWYRQKLDPFFEAARTRPFFWAWRPAQYPDEVGYAWLTSDPSMTNQRANGMVEASFQMQGVR